MRTCGSLHSSGSQSGRGKHGVLGRDPIRCPELDGPVHAGWKGLERGAQQLGDRVTTREWRGNNGQTGTLQNQLLTQSKRTLEPWKGTCGACPEPWVRDSGLPAADPAQQNQVRDTPPLTKGHDQTIRASPTRQFPSPFVVSSISCIFQKEAKPQTIKMSQRRAIMTVQCPIFFFHSKEQHKRDVFKPLTLDFSPGAAGTEAGTQTMVCSQRDTLSVAH